MWRYLSQLVIMLFQNLFGNTVQKTDTLFISYMAVQFSSLMEFICYYELYGVRYSTVWDIKGFHYAIGGES